MSQPQNPADHPREQERMTNSGGSLDETELVRGDVDVRTTAPGKQLVAVTTDTTIHVYELDTHAPDDPRLIGEYPSESATGLAYRSVIADGPHVCTEAVTEAYRARQETGNNETTAGPRPEPDPDSGQTEADTEPAATGQSTATDDGGSDTSKPELQQKVADALRARGAPMSKVTLGAQHREGQWAITIDDDYQAMDTEEQAAFREATGKDCEWIEVNFEKRDGQWIPSEKYVQENTIEAMPEVFG
jgi:hypothetical protein